MSPSIGISAGKDNQFGHPHPETLEALAGYAPAELTFLTVDNGTSPTARPSPSRGSQREATSALREERPSVRHIEPSTPVHVLGEAPHDISSTRLR